ncbi:MAG TPA: hypothetical protein VGH33_02035, partial [Isosphaeraceae bacterium]
MTRLPSPFPALVGFVLVAANPLSAWAQAPAKKAEPVRPSASQRDGVRRTLKSLQESLARLSENHSASTDLKADARVFYRAASLMEDLDEYSRADDVAMLTALLAESDSRRTSIARGEAPWAHATGSVVRGYLS